MVAAEIYRRVVDMVGKKTPCPATVQQSGAMVSAIVKDGRISMRVFYLKRPNGYMPESRSALVTISSALLSTWNSHNTFTGMPCG